MLKLSFLGRPMVELGGEPVESFVSSKSLALLSYLALRKGSHTRKHLAGLLWGEMPEGRAKANLRMALYNLRNLLPEYLTVMRTTAAFDRKKPYWLDVEAFESELDSPEEHLASLRVAIELYRGELLEDLYVEDAPDFEAWLLEQREYLRLSFLQAVERLAGHLANQGDWMASIQVYRRLLVVEPLREDVHRQLMRVLARAGRYTPALKQYEICRRLLHEELRVEPMPETVALYERIRVARSKPLLQYLPSQLTSFWGRKVELEKISRLLKEPTCRLITLVGPGGIGKSRLALQAAVDKAREVAFLEGVYFVPLASVGSTRLLAPAIADALHFAFQGQAEPRMQLINYLRNQEILLVLDNFEHLIEGGTGLLTEILTHAPEVKLLITSREQLNLQEEWLIEIEGLSFPKPTPDSIPGGGTNWEDLERHSAMQLFVERARHVQSNFSLLEGERAVVVHICQLVEGMPLGIEMAAAQVRSISCKTIAKEIERSLGFLATSLRNVPDRHQSMQAVFDYSWSFLSTEEKAVFKKLSVFRGGFTREAAHRVTHASLQILSKLVDKSFLYRNSSNRYEIHELLRQYGEEKLHAIPQEWEDTQNLHTVYFASFLNNRAEHLKGEKQKEALQEIGAEIDNVRAAWHWAVERRNKKAIHKSLEGLWAFYELRGWCQEGEEMFRNATYSLRGVFEEFSNSGLEFRTILGKMLARWGWICWRLGHYKQGKVVLQESLFVLRQVEQSASREVAFSLFQLGAVGLYLGDYFESRQFLQESLMISKQVGDQFISARSLMGLALVAQSLGEYSKAKQFQEEGLTHFRAIKDQRGIENSLIWAEGRIRIAQGDFEGAERLLIEGIASSQELMDKFGLALAYNFLGDLVYLKGEYLKSKQLQQESTEIFQKIGDQWGVALALNGLGNATWILGEVESAHHHFCEALKIAMEIGTLPVALEALVGLATLLHAGDQNEHALEMLEFVRNHSASSHETRVKAMGLIANIETELLNQEVVAARKRGQVNTLDIYVEEILGKIQ